MHHTVNTSRTSQGHVGIPEAFAKQLACEAEGMSETQEHQSGALYMEKQGL